KSAPIRDKRDIVLGSAAPALSGESMPQDRRDGRKTGYRLCARAALHGFAAAALGLVLGLNATGASAQPPAPDSVWTRAMRSLGLRSAPEPGSEISYTERPPLVVPPSRELPPPSDQPAPTAAWPRGSSKTIKHARAANEVVPSTAMQNPNPPF